MAVTDSAAVLVFAIPGRPSVDHAPDVLMSRGAEPFIEELTVSDRLPSPRLRQLGADMTHVVRLVQTNLATNDVLIASQRAWRELSLNFGIVIPWYRCLIGLGPPAIYARSNYSSPTGAFVVCQYVSGVPILDADLPPDRSDALLGGVYRSLIAYCEYKWATGGSYVSDIHNRQFVYGTTPRDGEPCAYLIDLDPGLLELSTTARSPRELISFFGCVTDILNMITEAIDTTAAGLEEIHALGESMITRLAESTDAPYPGRVQAAFANGTQYDWHKWLDETE